jgi:hypothetical protein
MDERAKQNMHGSEQDLMGCIVQYDQNNNDVISMELRELVFISQNQQELKLKANFQELEKILKRQTIYNLIVAARPYVATSSDPKDFSIETANALFVYMLEKFARVKGSLPADRPFKMQHDWNLLFETTRNGNEVLTKNNSYVFHEVHVNKNEKVELFMNPEFVYKEIKSAVKYYRETRGRKNRSSIKRKREEVNNIDQNLSADDAQMVRAILEVEEDEGRSTLAANISENLRNLGRNEIVSMKVFFLYQFFRYSN